MTDYYVDDEEYESFGGEYPGEEPVDYPASRQPGRRANVEVLEGSGTWAYLLLLLGLCVLLTLFAKACNNDDSSALDAAAITADDSDAASGPARLFIGVNRDVVALEGRVWDEETRNAIVAAATEQYGAENVIDELVVDEGVSPQDSVVTVSGRAAAEDARPAALQQRITSDLPFTVNDVSVERSDSGLAPAELAAVIDGGSVALSGTVPDQFALDRFVDAAQTVWGEEAVDTSGIIVGATVLDGGRLLATGSVVPGDERYLEFERFLTSRFGSELVVDVSAVGSSIDPETLAELESRIAEVVTNQPILFAPRSAEIDASSDAVVQAVATLLQEIPGVPVDVVGHTDDEGFPDENLELSIQRAAAVKTRLEDLGIDSSRLNSRGEGQAFPAFPNDTDENRAKNRRIEFLVVGAADAEDTADN